MMLSKLALVAMLAAGAVNAVEDLDFDPRRSASRSRRRSLNSRNSAVTIEADDSSSGVLVEEDIYGGMVDVASTEEEEEVAAFAAATDESPCGPGWKLLWNDEFKYTGKLDKNAWSYLEGDGRSFGIPGWGNNELQTYTKSSKNVRISNGKLNLIARRDGKVITSGAVRTYKNVAVAPKKNGVIRVDGVGGVPLHLVGDGVKASESWEGSLAGRAYSVRALVDSSYCRETTSNAAQAYSATNKKKKKKEG